jgi:hypothetical protein
MNSEKQVIRAAIKGAYDLQKLRIQTGLRLVAAFRVKLGVQSSEQEINLEEDAADVLGALRNLYDRLSDAIAAPNAKAKKVREGFFNSQELISNDAELALVASYVRLLNDEERLFKDIGKMVEKHPLWDGFLKGVRGCGTTMGAVIISEFDIHKARYVSSMWAYAGLDTAPDGKARSRRKEHLVEQTYIDANGDEQTKMGITFNPFLKTKLLGVLGSSFIKAGGKYREIYDNYKNRLQNRPDLSEESKGHIHNMAIRYAVKIFIQDLYAAWKAIEGLEAHEPYHVAKLGLRDHNAPSS